ncbi:hypothetical protein CQW23_12570 [Capsicum baccatum]|uniref:Ubiquitin-like protease family profile domain-containing protein n=1 Tax=Capsicum baccatum TaxID=33114 RepID=A0A2G2WT39_CAPBA|nr:hypothetical protein CQW23_12570 [Capsicum baccatum]
MNMVTRSISRSDPDIHTVPTFDLGISQTKEEDALPSEEVKGIRHKRKVTDDVSSSENDDDELVKEGPNVEVVADIPTVPQSSPQDTNASHFGVSNQSDTSTVELQRGHNAKVVEDIPVVSQLSSQHIDTYHFNTPKQSDTYSVELQQCHSKYRNRDESDPFEVIFVSDIPQQRSGGVDCGIYVAAYAEFLIGGQGVPNEEFDIALLRT